QGADARIRVPPCRSRGVSRRGGECDFPPGDGQYRGTADGADFRGGACWPAGRACRLRDHARRIPRRPAPPQRRLTDSGLNGSSLPGIGGAAMHAAMGTTEIFLIALLIIFTVPYLVWRV